MDLNVTTAALVNAAGAFLFVAAGIAILVLGRRSRRGRLVGSFASTFGLTFVVENLLPYLTDPLAAAIVAISAGLTVLAIAGLSVELARGATRAGRMAVAAAATLVALVLVGIASILATTEDAAANTAFADPGQVIVTVYPLFLVHIVQTGLLVLLCACAAAYRACPPESREQRRALAFLALSFGPFAVFINISNAINSWAPGLGPATWTWVGLYFARGLLAMAAGAAFIPSRHSAESGFSLRVALGLLAAGVAAAALGAIFLDGRDVGAYGVVRMVGVVFLALSVLKHELLGVPLPHLAVKRGMLATGALASLFIVAQVAQNFFAAQYGLLMGGVVAGTMVFAASPLQRAMERASTRQLAEIQESRATSMPPRGRQDEAGKRREDAYLNAVRLALRDRRITREEEGHLHHLAEALGIPAGRAHDLLVAAETGRPGKRGKA